MSTDIGVGVMDGDRSVLLASQARAKRVLSKATKDSAKLLENAEASARDLLLSQARLAADLLLRQHELAARALLAAQGQAGGMNASNGEVLMKQHRASAVRLSDEEAHVAVALVEAEGRLAVETKDAAMTEACRVLMSGHREAAAILLENRMRVADRLGIS